MKESLDQECRELTRAIMKEFLTDHLKDKTLDDLTYEVLLENLEDYI